MPGPLFPAAIEPVDFKSGGGERKPQLEGHCVDLSAERADVLLCAALRAAAEKWRPGAQHCVNHPLMG